MAAEVKKDFVIYSSNRQYSYSPTVLGRVGLDHECEAHAWTFSPRGQTNMRKLRLNLSNLRNIFNIVKFRRAYITQNTEFGTDDNTERFQLHTTDTHKRKGIIIIRRKLCKKDSSIDILTQ